MTAVVATQLIFSKVSGDAFILTRIVDLPHTTHGHVASVAGSSEGNAILGPGVPELCCQASHRPP